VCDHRNPERGYVPVGNLKENDGDDDDDDIV
jgi:hypothetical protein